MTLVYVTPENLEGFAIEKYPFSKVFKYLSNRHKREYLRAFFNHFYGGGYTSTLEGLKNWETGRTKSRKSILWMVGDLVDKEEQVP